MIEPGIYPNISHASYHAMKDVVSNSYLQRLNQCPAAAKVPMIETPALTFGRAFHSFVLDGQESFERDFAVLSPMDRRTKEGKAAYALFCEKSGDKTIIDDQENQSSIVCFFLNVILYNLQPVSLLLDGLGVGVEDVIASI